jgi:hypothetical protein
MEQAQPAALHAMTGASDSMKVTVKAHGKEKTVMVPRTTST